MNHAVVMRTSKVSSVQELFYHDRHDVKLKICYMYFLEFENQSLIPLYLVFVVSSSSPKRMRSGVNWLVLPPILLSTSYVALKTLAVGSYLWHKMGGKNIILISHLIPRLLASVPKTDDTSKQTRRRPTKDLGTKQIQQIKLE